MNIKVEKMKNFYPSTGRLICALSFVLFSMMSINLNAQCNLNCPGDFTVSIPFGDCVAPALVTGANTSGPNCNAVINGFAGEFTPSDWSFTSTGNGSANVAGAPASVSVTGNNNGFSGSSMLCIEMDFTDFVTPLGDELNTTNGVLSFDWNYVSNNSHAGYDPFFVRLNGIPTQLTAGAEGTAAGGTLQNGSHVMPVSDGDIFCFDQRSFDGTFGGATTTITNFTLTFDYEMTLYEGLADGEDFPLGTTTVSYAAFSGLGAIQTCTFDVTVEEDADPVSSISCNNVVQISLDSNCEAIVEADQILEGTGYGCYDKYTVEITDENGNNYGNFLTSVNIGQTLTVKVTGPNGNSCWGEIEVADKSLPPVLCEDSWTRCHLGTDPGDLAESSFSYTTPGPQAINDNGATVIPLALGLGGFSIDDINVSVNLNHDAINELQVTLTSPAPGATTVTLFDLTSSACFATGNIDVHFDDDATLTAVDFNSTCNSFQPSLISGDFQPFTALNGFNGIDAGGTWVLTIVDNSAGNTGTLNSVTIDFEKDPSLISFPWPTTATWTQVGNQVYEVIGLDPCGLTTVFYEDEDVPQDCSTPYERIIERTWNGFDAAGNQAIECTQNIYVFRNDLTETLVWPRDYDDVDLPALSCLLYKDVVPGTNVTGVPTGDFCEHVQIAPHTDIKIDICESEYKIIRKWSILDWCTGIIYEHDQVIKVIDQSLELFCPIGVTEVFADDYSCTGSYVLPAPTVQNECSSWTYNIEGVLLPDTNGAPETGAPRPEYISGNTAINLPFGTSWVVYSAEDACGNTDECMMEFNVSDNSPPVAVCDESTVVSVGPDGWGVVQAITFDDGSWDNCGIQSMHVRRMTSGCGNTSWGDEVQFCCDEVGEVLMVAFRVTDLYGNQNTCMVEVTVQDKLPPYTDFCPDDVTIDCATDYADLSIFGAPVFVDNCSNTSLSSTESSNIDNCGQGTIVRTWTFEDLNNGFKASCEQTITVANSSPFTSADISWAPDYTTTGCNTNLDPENLPAPFNAPNISDDKCSLAAATYEDQVFSFSDDACLKILRTWTVIDWCTYDGVNGIYTDLQIIKLNNTVAPEFVSGCQDTLVCHYNDGCLGDVTLSVAATDDCTDASELMYWWEVDAFNTGDHVFEYNGSGSTMTLNNLPQGVHYIRWYVEDRCGNVTNCDYLFEVKDCKKPTPYCLSTVTSVVMNNNGMLEIWANDFDFGSFDNCTDQSDLQISFSEDVNNTSMTFTCAQMPDGQQAYIPLQMWVTDEAGNQDYCEIAIILQDNEGDACDDLTGDVSYITGRISNETSEMMEDVAVEITSNQPLFPKNAMTDVNGQYTFNNLIKNQTYYITAEKLDDPMNGVSTLDLVLIQKHILQLQLLDSPYKVIASDANNDGNVSAIDLVHIRKLILGIVTEFPNEQTSWRFVDNSFTFSDPMDPFPYDEIIDFVNLDQSMVNQDFMAVKIADVTENALPNNFATAEVDNRSNTSLDFIIDNEFVSAGELVTIPVYASNFDKYLGYQFAINFDNTKANFVDFNSGAIELSENNFGFTALEDGIILTSWNSANVVKADEDEILFELTFEANSSFDLDEFLSFNSSALMAEAYTSQLEVDDIKLLYRNENGALSSVFELYQNTPNPFADKTAIAFNSPLNTVATLEVFDVTGRLIFSTSKAIEAGFNMFEINKRDLNTKGVMYYKVSGDGFSATKKMIGL